MGINSFNDGAADQGSPTSLANAWPVVVTDGTNTVGVTDNNLNVTLGNNPKVGITDYVFSYDNIVSTFGEIKTASTIQRAGGKLSVSPPDVGIWLSSLVNGGSQTVSGGELVCHTGTTANGSVSIYSQDIGIFSSGSANIYIAGVRLPDIGTTNNRRRWGVFSSDLADAAYYEINGTTVNIGIRKGSSDTVVSSFNGGNSFVLDINYHLYEIYYTQGAIIFLQDKKLIHKVTPTTTTLTSTLTFLVRFENTNLNSSTIDVHLYARSGMILRLGASNDADLNTTNSLLTEGMLTFSSEFTSGAGGIVPSQTIITPTSGKKISIKNIVINIESNGTVEVDFLTSAIKVYRIYSGGNNFHQTGVMHIEGAPNAVLSLSAYGMGANKKLFILVAYDLE